MDWSKYDDIKVLNAIYGGDRAAVWAKRTFYGCFGGFVILALLIVFK